MMDSVFDFLFIGATGIEDIGSFVLKMCIQLCGFGFSSSYIFFKMFKYSHLEN